MEKKIRTHRVGAITAGVSMIVFGVLFLLHIVVDTISYESIVRLWPLMIIGIGVEVLVSSFSIRRFVYDKAAVFLLFMVAIFAVCMAGADMCLTYLAAEIHMSM